MKNFWKQLAHYGVLAGMAYLTYRYPWLAPVTVPAAGVTPQPASFTSLLNATLGGTPDIETGKILPPTPKDSEIKK